MQIEPRLVQRLLNAEFGDDRLVMLQHALWRLWAQAEDEGAAVIRLEHYSRIGVRENWNSKRRRFSLVFLATKEP